MTDIEIAHLGIECDMGSCEKTLTGDFVVKAGLNFYDPQRFEAIYAYVETLGWEVFRKMNVTYCPEHAAKDEEK